MSNKVISFVVPCFNSAEYMDNCIQHLMNLNTNADDIEIIIVDDGSQKDNTYEKAKAWESRFPGVIRAIYQENGGHGQAVNTGLKNANGLYFKVVDSDDWLDNIGTMPIMDYLRKQANLAKEGQDVTDMVVGNYVYNKVYLGVQTEINYGDVFPENREFTWEEIGKFKPSVYLLMHSVIYKTSILKDMNLELPKHTFYVDNIFVYEPLINVKSIYYINTKMYMYFIGREDQSVNEDIMKSRIDQQLKITKIMIDSTDYDELSVSPKLGNYMLGYLSMMMCICSVFLRMIDTEDAELKRMAIWDYLKKHDPRIYDVVRKSLICFGTNIPTALGRAIGIGGYKLAQKLFSFN